MKPWNCAAALCLLLAAPLQLAAQADDSRWSAPSAGEAGEFVPADVERGDLTTYPGLTEFLDAAGEDLTLEDFEGGFADAGLVKVCFESLGHASDDPCFVPGDLEAGFSLHSSRGSINATGLAALGAGVIGNTDTVVGANALSPPDNPTRIHFDPAPTAVAMDVYEGQQGQPVSIQAFDSAGQTIGGFTVAPGGVSQPEFAGFTSPVPVAWVEVNGTEPGAGELIDNLRFGGGDGHLEVAPAEIAFGAVRPGEAPETELVLTNAGALDLEVATASVPDAPFAVGDDPCSGTTLAPGASCTLTLSFAPPHSGPFQDELELGETGVDVRGNGVVAQLTGAPRSLDFGSVPADGAGDDAVRLANRQAVPVTIETIETPPAPFALAGGDCPEPPFSLDPGDGCELGFEYAPDDAGSHAGTARVHHDGEAGVLRLHLAGEGSDSLTSPSAGSREDS